MKIALLRTSVAVAILCGFGLTAGVDAQQPAGSGRAPGEQPAGAPQEVRVTVLTPEGGRQPSATVERQQVLLADGATVTVLRPVAPAGAKAPRPEAEVQREGPLAWQVAAGGRLWLVDPATGDLRTCAMRQTSTVGLKVLRCLSVGGAGL